MSAGRVAYDPSTLVGRGHLPIQMLRRGHIFLRWGRATSWRVMRFECAEDRATEWRAPSNDMPLPTRLTRAERASRDVSTP